MADFKEQLLATKEVRTRTPNSATLMRSITGSPKLLGPTKMGHDFASSARFAWVILGAGVVLLAYLGFVTTRGSPLVLKQRAQLLCDQQQTTLVAAQKLQAEAGKLRIFVYDVPAQLTDHFYTTKTAKFNQYAGEYWLFAALNATRDEQKNLSAVVVDDPEEADVFYVPVFLGLAWTCADALRGLELYPGQKNECPPKAVIDIYQDAIFDYLQAQPSFRKSGGFDHILPYIHPIAGGTLLDRIPNAIFLAVDFTWVNAERVSVEKDITVPHTHPVPAMPYDGRVNETDFPGSYSAPRKYLIMFRGAVGAGGLRGQILPLYSNFTEVLITNSGSRGDEGTRLAAQEMRDSEFCFHISGDTASAARFFDAIVNLCIPVIICPGLELPFESQIDYSFMLRATSEMAQNQTLFLDYLRSFSGDEKREMRRKLDQIRYQFEYVMPDGTFGGAMNMIFQEIQSRLPIIRLKSRRYQRGLSTGLHRR